MSPGIIFSLGLLILGLFGWYFMEADPFRKKVTATLLTLLLVGLCITSFWPPFDARDPQGNILRDDKGNVALPGKIRLGLDLKGGTAFQVRLIRPDRETPLTKEAQEQAVEVIRGRVDKFGVGEPIISPVGEEQILDQIPDLDTNDIAQVYERVKATHPELLHPNLSKVTLRPWGAKEFALMDGQIGVIIQEW